MFASFDLSVSTVSSLGAKFWALTVVKRRFRRLAMVVLAFLAFSACRLWSVKQCRNKHFE
jgi:hypothetical protein